MILCELKIKNGIKNAKIEIVIEFALVLWYCIINDSQKFGGGK